MIHFHGTPLTPRAALHTMAGKHFCVSFADPRDADVCQRIGQSVLWDNGAFSIYTRGIQVDWAAYYEWVEPRLGHPHWAIVPDVIDGTPSQNWCLAQQWPHPKALSAPVWHMADPLEHLHRFVDAGWVRVCFGSSGIYWQIGSEEWERRCDKAFNSLAKNGPLPWVHMLRGLALAGKRWPFASADSANVARNYKDTATYPEYMARTLDAVQCPSHWELRHEQMELIE